MFPNIDLINYGDTNPYTVLVCRGLVDKWLNHRSHDTQDTGNEKVYGHSEQLHTLRYGRLVHRTQTTGFRIARTLYLLEGKRKKSKGYSN